MFNVVIVDCDFIIAVVRASALLCLFIPGARKRGVRRGMSVAFPNCRRMAWRAACGRNLILVCHRPGLTWQPCHSVVKARRAQVLTSNLSAPDIACRSSRNASLPVSRKFSWTQLHYIFCSHGSRTLCFLRLWFYWLPSLRACSYNDKC